MKKNDNLNLYILLCKTKYTVGKILQDHVILRGHEEQCIIECAEIYTINIM